MKRTLRFHLISVFSVLAFIGVWYLLTDVLQLVNPLLMPSPVTVFKTFIRKLTVKNPDGGTLGEHTISSLKLVVSGYLLGIAVGTPLGVAMAWNKWVDRFVRPLFDLLRPVPPIGWIPLVMVLFGIGTFAKVFIIFFATLVPSTVNAYTGIRQVSETHLWVARTFGASRSQMLWKVAIPSAMPMLFTGLRVSLSTSWGTLVAAEMLAAQKGLGYMIQFNRMFLNSDIILVGMILIGVIGAMLTMILGAFEKILVRGR